MPLNLTLTPPRDFIEFRQESIWQGIHQRIEEQARLYPRNVALKSQRDSLTYAETNGYANSIADQILSVGGTHLAQAALLLPNTPEMIVGILACLKAHKAYVPLDPHFPKERLRAMVKDTEPAVLLTDDHHLGLAQELAGTAVHIVNTTRIARDVTAPNPGVACDPMDRAYILFTSGSTGRPKGIAFLHRNLLHSTMCLTNNLFFASSDRVTWLHSASFAASVVDIYCCLTNGGALYSWDAKTQGFSGLAEWLAVEKVTTFQWIPSAFRQFLRTVSDDFLFPTIRIVVMASEALTIREVELFRRHFPAGSHLVNQVGTSESYNYRLYAVDHGTKVSSANVPAGYPVSEDRQVVILNGDYREVPVGSIGEIGVKSDYMSAGYWCNDVLTQSKFIRPDGDTVPVYLTGDLGRLAQDGCLIHLGRKDSQVKIRGYRVELTEIDHMLTGVPGVIEATSSVAKDRRGEDQLVGYVVLKEDGGFDQAAAERHLGSRLPEYMVPRHYVVLDSLPTLPNGKTDRKGLPNPFERRHSDRSVLAADVNPGSSETVALFKDVLQSSAINFDSDFVTAGGDSLSAAVLLSRIHQRFAVGISMDEFSQSPTPSHLAGLIEAARRTEGGLPPLSSETDSKESKWRDTARDPLARASQILGSSSSLKNLVIICAGGLGREVFTWAVQSIAAGAPWRIKGFLDSNPDALARHEYECGVIGDPNTYEIEEDDVFIGALGNPMAKVRCYSPIIDKGGQFINVIHPLANIGRNVRLGTGVVLAPFSSVTSDICVGNHVSIGALSNVGHDAAIGDWCHINSFCGINGNALLHEGVFMGSHACIVPGVDIGPWAFVGAGSVVVENVAPRTKVFGNPAVPIGKC